MYKNILAIILAFPLISAAQVGINTTNPQETLHIAGANSGVRVDALNETNNALNLKGTNSTRVFVDADGDLVLAPATNNLSIVFNAQNYLSDPKDTGGADKNDVLQTGTGSGYTAAGWPRIIGPGTSTFTLTKPAIVEINYSLSFQVEKSGDPIGDGHARIIQTFMVLRNGSHTGPIVNTDLDGVPIILGGALGLSGQFLTNASATTGASGDGAGKQYINTGTDYVKLGPGTYSPMFFGQIVVGDASGTGAVKMFLGTGQDEVQIIAHYYN
jgi:hypothetical protein